MEREDVLRSANYWTTNIQIELYNCAMTFMKKNGMDATQLAEYLGVSKEYVSQLLSGDYDYSLNNLVETALKMGYVPKIEFKPIEEVIKEDLDTRRGL